ncbi:fatty acyl-CoA reductase 1-like [Amphiura filiformis]|uniref:fatty acyl-CoA reductase 1-like n=1 Tax=Amphiura filiformis TaxID=82378 RepID=UPI003B20DABC
MWRLNQIYITPSGSPNPLSMDHAAKPDIPESFAGRSVLITGATGFIGKVLVEKILRCCPDVKKLYLLIRPGKRGDSIQKRLQQITNTKLFDRLRECQEGFEDKIVPVQADLLQPKLGLSDEDIKTLQANVSIVFHVAATIKFNEVLKLSLQLNVKAVQMLLDLSRGMDLQAFVHVSTAYSNCIFKDIEEKVYPPTVDPYKLLSTVDWMSEDMVKDMTPYLLGDYPNTYTFTKAIAETVLVKESVGMPLCIVRPSIVGASWKDPIPGWVDNLAGATGLMIAGHKGLLQSILGNEDVVADITPVDLVVNTLVTSAWHIAVNRPTQIPVINLVTSPNNPVTMKDIAIHIYPPTSFAYTENQ